MRHSDLNCYNPSWIVCASGVWWQLETTPRADGNLDPLEVGVHQVLCPQTMLVLFPSLLAIAAQQGFGITSGNVLAGPGVPGLSGKSMGSLFFY